MQCHPPLFSISRTPSHPDSSQVFVSLQFPLVFPLDSHWPLVGCFAGTEETQQSLAAWPFFPHVQRSWFLLSSSCCCFWCRCPRQGLGDGFQQSLAQCATFTTVTADAEAVGCALTFGFGPLTFAKVALPKAGCVHWIMNSC